MMTLAGYLSSSHNVGRLLGVLVVALCARGCGASPELPISRITGPRVLAVLSEPSSLAIDKQARLSVLVVDEFGPRQGVPGAAGPGDRPVDAIRWRACAPWRFIADPVRDCSGSDAFNLGTTGSGQTDISATELEAAFPAPPEGSAFRRLPAWMPLLVVSLSLPDRTPRRCANLARWPS